MKIFEIPLLKHFINFSPNQVTQREDPVCLFEIVDGKITRQKGVIVKHSEGPNRFFRQKELLGYLVGQEKTSCFIPGESPEEALEIFFSQWWPGAVFIGGSTPESKAICIDSEMPIIEYPDCPLLHLNRGSSLICGEESMKASPDSFGEFGYCILSGAQSFMPEGKCPIKIFRKLKPEQKATFSVTTPFGTFKVVSAKELIVIPD